MIAHVDAGKTTLSEAILYKTGMIRTLGRVDHGDAFLDTDRQERDRGITIFSKQAEIRMPDGMLMLLDTPGHVDFSAEMERTLSVLDCAVLVISGKDGVQGHTATLWRLLGRYHIPAFIFINKMDLEGTDRSRIMRELCSAFGSGCVDMTDGHGADTDALSMCSERLMEEILETGEPSDDALSEAVAERSLFPCYFGSALRLQGIDTLINDIWSLARPLCGVPGAKGSVAAPFAARVYKITRDPKGNRLTHMKITGGCLRVKDVINGEKAEQLRVYSGEKFYTEDTAEAGSICAVAGLADTYAGQGLGAEKDSDAAVIEPVMTYRLIPAEGDDPHTVYMKLRQLEEEDPQLRLIWNEHMQLIQLQLMGRVQLEVLQNIIKDRLGYDISFGEGRITYRETLAAPVLGGGHFEPLRHYAEVHLLMEPAEPGSGIVISSSCSADELDTNWQRLIMTHIAEKNHTGVLTGSPLCDVRITVVAGRAHRKHTEGGDFRQATYRAIRQGLMKARQAGACVLLEPWYEFRMELPADAAGRAMTDIQRMGGSFEPPVISGESTVLEGRAPAAELKEYQTQLSAYTRGFGRMMYTMSGYAPCHNPEEVIEQEGYEPEADLENTADSVFCGHGSGYNVKWSEADKYFHIQVSLAASAGSSQTPEDKERELQRTAAARSTSAGGTGGIYSSGRAEDEELRRIFERTYGAGSADGGRRAQQTAPRVLTTQPEYRPTKPAVVLPEYIFVDGYNVIFAWDELKELAKVNIDSAREALIDILVNYQGYRKCLMTVVFDAYRIKGGVRHEEKRGDVEVIFTKEDETADTYIERTTYGMEKSYLVRVVSSDRLEQQMIIGNGAFRMSAAEFRAEVEAVNNEIKGILGENAERVRKQTRRGIDISGAASDKNKKA